MYDQVVLVTVLAFVVVGYFVGVACAYCTTGQDPVLPHHVTALKLHIQRLVSRALRRAPAYRRRAAEFRAKGRTAATRQGAKEFYELANRYARLADQAEAKVNNTGGEDEGLSPLRPYH